MDFKSHGFATPRHSYVDDTPYFITAATYQHRRLLNDEIKTLLQQLLQEVFTEYSWRLDHWVILDNHYHLLATSRHGRDLPKIINKIHALSSQRIRCLTPLPKQVWYNYWDYCPRNQREYDVRLCYLLSNPFKHGYVEGLKDWCWSSFHQLFKREGGEALRERFREYRAYRELVLPEDAGAIGARP